MTNLLLDLVSSGCVCLHGSAKSVYQTIETLACLDF